MSKGEAREGAALVDGSPRARLGSGVGGLGGNRGKMSWCEVEWLAARRWSREVVAMELR